MLWPVALIVARSRLIGFAIIIAASLYGCGTQPSPTSDHAPAPRPARATFAAAEAANPSPQSAAGALERRARFAAVPCWFDVASDREIDCGELTVPENWSKPESKLIHLPVVIFRATAATKEPIVFLNGGPGARSRVRTADEIRAWRGLLWVSGGRIGATSS
jgi:hypothetical protein